MPACQSAAFVAAVLIALTEGARPRLAAEEPTADGVKGLLAKYRAERDEAKAFHAPAGAFAAAETAAARAEAAAKAGDLKAAARLARDARWQLPTRPAGLPPHVGLVIGSVRLRHADRVNGLAYSPDGTKLASASRDGTVRVWDLGNGHELLAYRGHPAPPPVSPDKPVDGTAALRVPAVAWSPTGALVASAGGDEIHLWDPATGKRVKALKKHAGMVRALAFGPDGARLASTGDDRLLVVWDVAAGKDTFTGTLSARPEAVAYSPNGKLVAAADADGFVTVFRPDGGDKKPVMRAQATDGGGQQATGVAFTPDGAKLLAGGYDKNARLLAAPAAAGTAAPAAAAPLLKFTGHSEPVSAVGITPDGKLAVTGGQDRTVRVWDAVGGKPVRLFQGHLDRVTALAVRPDGRQVASGSEDGTIRLWDLSAVDEHRAMTDATDAVWAAVYAPDGSRFAAAGADRAIRVYDAAGKLEHTLTGHKGAVTSLVFSATDRLASAAGDALIKLWDARTGTFEKDLAGHTSAVLALAATADGRLVSAAADRTVKLWDVPAGKPVWSWAGKSAACAVAVRPDGKRVAVGTADGTLTILDVTADGPKEVGSAPAHVAGVAAVAFSPDGAKLATVGGDGVVKLWAVPDEGTPVPTARFESAHKSGPAGAVAALSAVGFSPDGRQVVSGGADAIVRVWDAATGAEARALRGHTDWVTAAAFSPDGEKVLSAGVDKAVRVFDLGRSDLGGRAGHAQAARCVAVSRDGTRVASGSDDRTVKVWDLATGAEVATLTGMADKVFCVGFAGPNRVAAGAGSGDRRLRVWDVPGGKEVRSWVAGQAYALVATADGKTVTVWARTADEKDEFAAYTVADGTPAGDPLVDKDREATCAAISPDGGVAAAGAKDGSVRVWNLPRKDRIGDDWPILVKRVADIGLTPDKQTLLVIDEDGLVKVGDLGRREVTHSVKALAGEVNGLVVSPTGDRFAALGTDGVVKAFDLKAKELRSWALPVPANGAAFTPDGKKLVTANADGTLYVLELP